MKFSIKVVAFPVIAFCGVSSAFAGLIGPLGFAEIGAPKVDGGDFNAATSFKIGNFISTGLQSGDFVSFGTQDMGSISFDSTVRPSFHPNDAGFGTFDSTSISDSSSGPSVKSSYIAGTYAKAGGVDRGNALLTRPFTQTPAHIGAISNADTFSIPPGARKIVPATFALLGLGGLGFAVRAYRRRRAVF